jgi:hypothetical protein
MRALTDWWNRISLRTKITGVTVLLLTMGLLVAGVGTMTVLKNYLLDGRQEDRRRGRDHQRTAGVRNHHRCRRGHGMQGLPLPH